jgi:hypothetical protein
MNVRQRGEEEKKGRTQKVKGRSRRRHLSNNNNEVAKVAHEKSSTSKQLFGDFVHALSNPKFKLWVPCSYNTTSPCMGLCPAKLKD